MSYRNESADISPYRWGSHAGDNEDWIDQQPQKYLPPEPITVRRDTYVPARTVQPSQGDVTPGWLVERQPLSIEPVLTPMVTSMEQSGPLARARALQIRVGTLLALYAVLAVVVGTAIWMVAGIWPVGAMTGALVFVALGSASYLKLNSQDYAHSAHGTERFRIDTAADLAHARMQHEHELRRMALEAYLRNLEGHNGK